MISDIGDKTELLRNTRIFSKLDKNDLEFIAEASSFRSYAKGEIVFLSGSPSEELYLVQKGDVLISREAEGREVDIARFIQGDMFGEMELLQNLPRNATAKSESDSVLLVFPGNGVRFQDLLRDNPAVSAGILHEFLVIIAGRIRKTNSLIKENSPVVQELRKQVYGDKLTGLFNKTYLEENLGKLLCDPHNPVSLFMVKPDNFKLINDEYGHEAGDHALQIMAGALQKVIKPDCFAVRFMGNELSIAFPSCSKCDAESFAASLRSMMNSLDLSEITGGKDFRLSVSIGIAVFPDHADNAEELIAKAHELPLIGRARGGNVILFPEDKG